MSNSAYSRPEIVVFRGLPGTGKSTLANALARELGIPIFDRDILKVLALELFGDDAMAGVLSYRQLVFLTEKQLEVGLGAILDGPFTRPEELELVTDIGKRAGVLVKLVHCVAPIEVVSERIRQRQGNQTQWSGEGGIAQMTMRLASDRFARGLLSPEPVEGADLLVVDTSRPFEECLAEIVGWRHV